MFMKRSLILVLPLMSAVVFNGCLATGQQYRSNVFKADQVNKQQDVKVVDIIAILDAKIEVDNTEGKKNAQIGGALLGGLAGVVVGNQRKNSSTSDKAIGGGIGALAGGAAGSLVADKILVDGVSLTYKDEFGKILNSTQVGKSCEFQPGQAIVISTTEKETRIQSNAKCPEVKEN